MSDKVAELEKATVFVVDDDPGALSSLCWLLRQADFPVRPFASAREFLDTCRPEEPGCLLLDVCMPEMDGLQLQQCLGERGIGLPVIFITAHGDVANCARAFRAGAFDFLEKPVDDEVLLDEIQKAIARDTQQRQRQQGPASQFELRASRLTPREKVVMAMLVAGKSLKEIAIAGDVSVQTIWRHRVSILQKMEVQNDVELVRLVTLAAHSPRS
jgi:FixJ family two-component response regulator